MSDRGSRGSHWREKYERAEARAASARSDAAYWKREAMGYRDQLRKLRAATEEAIRRSWLPGWWLWRRLRLAVDPEARR